MPHDLMTRCDRRTKYKRNNEYLWDWKEVPVSEVFGADSKDLRCTHCHGRVRLHRQHVEHGPQDHVEHRSRRDSEGCRAGHYFQGTHRMSSDPVA